MLKDGEWEWWRGSMGEDRAFCRRKESIAGWRSGGKGNAINLAALFSVSMVVIRVGIKDGGSGCWIRAAYAES